MNDKPRGPLPARYPASEPGGPEDWPDDIGEMAAGGPSRAGARRVSRRPNDDAPRRGFVRNVNPVPFLIGAIGLLLLLIVGVVVMAFNGWFDGQPATVAAAQNQPVTADGAAQPASPGPAAGEPAAPAQPRLEVTKQATFGDWVYTCVKLPTGTDSRCAISQQLSDSKTKAPLFLWRIVEDGKGGLIGEWQTRSGIMVNRGIVLDAGTEKPIAIPFEACMPDGCRAVANLAPDVVATFAKATTATATVFPVGNNGGVKLTLSVNGFSDALAALKQNPPPATADAPQQPAQPAPAATPAPPAKTK